MEFTVKKDLFFNSLKIAEHVSSTKGIQIILSNVYIEATEKNQLIIKSTDLDIGMILKIDAKVKKTGKITLPSKKLGEIISKLPAEDINFEVNEDTNKAKITSGRAKFELLGIGATEYPVVLSEEEIENLKEDIKLEVKPFLRAIKQTVYAASTAENNSIYNGVYMKINEKELEMASTDGARLSTAVETIENKNNSEFEKIIHARTLNEFVRFQQGCDGESVEIFTKEGQVIFKIDENILIFRPLEGQYPKYKQIIPKDNDKIVTVNREEFINMIDRISPMVEEKKNIVKFIFDNSKITLVVNNPELGECSDSVDAEFDDEEIKIAFNYRFLLDVLRNYECEKVRIELKPTLSPTLLRPDTDDKYLALIMPMQIKE